MSTITTEQVENPVVTDLQFRLSTAESMQIKLELQSKQIFSEYPVKFTYEELQAVRKEVEDGLSNIAILKVNLAQQESENPLVTEEIQHMYLGGDWPITASDEWCGQWMEHSQEANH
jgi:hypothetical protein